MIFKLEASGFFHGMEPPAKKAIFVKLHGKGSRIGENVSEWKIKIDTFEELLELRDEVGFNLVVTKENSIIIYDGWLE